MKTKLITLLFAALVPSFALASNAEICNALSKSPVALKVTKTVEPRKDKLNKEEAALIQTTIHIVDPIESSTTESALEIFRDDSGDGAGAGQINYLSISINNKPVQLAKVVYFPGDNEYGAIFQLHTYSGRLHADLIATTGDGDISCLTLVR
jgi:hypothetical protein